MLNKDFKRIRNNKGFTLAELMIALVVSGVVATVIIALVTSFFRNAGRIDSGVNAWNRIQDANVQLQRDVNDAAQINMASPNHLELFILRDTGDGTRCHFRAWIADPELGTLTVRTVMSPGTDLNPAECSFLEGSQVSEQVIIRGLDPIANHPNAAEPRFVQDGVFTYCIGLDSCIAEHLLPLHRSDARDANLLNQVGRIEWHLGVAPDGRNLDITRDLQSAGAFTPSHINTGGGTVESPEAPEVSIMNPNETIHCPQEALDYMFTGGPRGTGLIVGVDRPAICWNDTSSALVNTTGWTIFRLMFPTGAELGSNRWHTVAQLPANEVFWVDPDLPAGWTALYVVQAEISTGNVLAPDGIGPESNSVISGLRPTPEIRMNAVGNQQTIDLTWEVVGGVHDAGIFGFDIYRDGVLIARVPASVTSFRDGPAEAYTGILLPENLRNLTRGHVQPTNTAAAAQSAAFRQLTWANRPGARAGEAGFGFTFDYQIVPVNRWEQIAVNETSAREGNEGRADLGINATRQMRNRRSPGGAFQNSGILRHGLEVRNDQAPAVNQYGVVQRALPNPQSNQTVSTRLVAAFTAPAAPVLAPVVHAPGSQGATGAARTHTLSWTPAAWLNADGATTSRGITAVTAGGTGSFTSGVTVNGVQPAAVGHRDAGWQVLYSLNSRAAFSNNQANDATPSAIRAVPFNPPATDNAIQFAVPVNGSFNTQAGTTAATITPANANLTLGAINSGTAAVNTFTFGSPTAANPNALLTGRHYHYAMFGVNGSGRGPINHETTISSWTRPANPTCAIGDITTRSMIVGSTLAATLDETYTFAQTVNLNGTTWARHNIRHSVGDTDITSRPWVAQNAAANELAQGISGPVGNTGTAGSGQRFNRLGAQSVAANTHTRNHDFQVQATGQGGFSDVVDCVDNHSTVTRTGTLPGPRFATDELGVGTITDRGVRTNTRSAEVDITFNNGFAIGNLDGWGGTSWTHSLQAPGQPNRTTLATHNPVMGTLSTQAEARANRPRNSWERVTLRFDGLGNGAGDATSYALVLTNTDGFNTVTVTRSGITTYALTATATNVNGTATLAITRANTVTANNTTSQSTSLPHGVMGEGSRLRWSRFALDGGSGSIIITPDNNAASQVLTRSELAGSIARPANDSGNHTRTWTIHLTDGHNTRVITSGVSLPPIDGGSRSAWNTIVDSHAVTRSGCVVAVPGQANQWVDAVWFNGTSVGLRPSLSNAGITGVGGCSIDLANASSQATAIRYSDGVNTREFGNSFGTAQFTGSARAWNPNHTHNGFTGTRSGCVEQSGTLLTHTWFVRAQVGGNGVSNGGCTDNLSHGTSHGASVTVGDGRNEHSFHDSTSTGTVPAPGAPPAIPCTTPACVSAHGTAAHTIPACTTYNPGTFNTDNLNTSAQGPGTPYTGVGPRNCPAVPFPAGTACSVNSETYWATRGVGRENPQATISFPTITEANVQTINGGGFCCIVFSFEADIVGRDPLTGATVVTGRHRWQSSGCDGGAALSPPGNWGGPGSGVAI